MATVNLGRIKPVWHGAWDNSTQYVAEDIVQYNNDTWIATTTNTNSAPADGNANWDLMARGVSAGSVTSNELADGAVTAAKIAAGTIPDPITTGTTAERPGGTAGKVHYDTTTNSLEYWNPDTSAGGSWISVAPFLTVRMNGRNGNVNEWTGNFGSCSRLATGHYRINFNSTEPNGRYIWYIDTDCRSDRTGNHVGPATGMTGKYFNYGINNFDFAVCEYASATTTDTDTIYIALWRQP